MKVYQALARGLIELEVENLFGLIGDANLYMVDSYVRDYKGKFTSSIHEVGSVLMALGYAQASGRIGVATVTHGPALTNTLTALVEGVKSGIPMVLLAGDTPSDDLEHLQKVNQREFIIATGAGFEQLRTRETIGADLTRCFYRAWFEKRPIVLNMPLELQWQDAPDEKLNLRLPEAHYSTSSGTEMDHAIGIIASSRLPVVVAGRGAIQSEARNSILRFAERIEAPVATTLRGKGLFVGEDFNLGLFGTLSHPVALDVITRSDCVISFGASFNKYTTARGALSQKKRIIQVGPNPAHMSRFTRFDAGLVGDPGLMAEAMISLLNEAEIPGSGGRTEDLRQSLQSYEPRTHFAKNMRSGFVDIIEALRAINSTLPEDRVFVTDTGRFIKTAWWAIDVQKPQDYVHTTSFAAIGLGLGQAIGAATAADGRPTLLVSGDGGFMLAGVSELVSAVREKLDLVIVICNDGSYGAEHIQFRNKDMPPDLSLFAWPDFVPVAKSLGADGATVRSSNDLKLAMAALKQRDRSRPFLIDLKLDPDSIPVD